MRIGEVLVISSPDDLCKPFIASVCNGLEQDDEKTCFGRLLINDQLALHLYGTHYDGQFQRLSWDLLSLKLLGYVILFDWAQSSTLSHLTPLLDMLASHFDAPLLVAGCVDDESAIPMHQDFYAHVGIPVEKETRYSFCHIHDPASTRNILKILIDILLEKVE